VETRWNVSEPWDWGRYRAYLRIRARMLRLDPSIRVQFDESDLVNETLLRGHERQDQCQATAHEPRMAWLEQIQNRLLIDRVRFLHAQERDVRREQELEQQLNESTVFWARNLAASQPTPSEVAGQKEQFLRACEALEQLPERERDVLIAHLILGLSLRETGEKLGLGEGAPSGDAAKNAAAGLYARGIRRLRDLLGAPPSG
jgi:RNA polymerase sigma-70 factor (subfamily 1)